MQSLLTSLGTRPYQLVDILTSGLCEISHKENDTVATDIQQLHLSS